MIKTDLRYEQNNSSQQKIRVNPSLDQTTHEKLKRLAISCDMTKTHLAAEIIEMALNHLDVVNWFQEKYNHNDIYKITPVRDGHKLYY